MRHIFNSSSAVGPQAANRGPHATDPVGWTQVPRGDQELQARLLVRPVGEAIMVKCFNMELPHDDHETAAIGPSLMALAKLGYVRILLDLQGVDFASGSLLGSLASLHQHVVQSNGFFIVFGLEPMVRNALRICHLDGAIATCESESDAISAYHEWKAAEQSAGCRRSWTR